MKYFYSVTLTLITLLNLSFTYSKNNNDNYNNNLYYTCKVWGYLKYFHTSVADGLVVWDDVLLENLPKLESVNSKEEFNNFLSSFFNAAGKMADPIGALPIVPDDLKYNLKTEWFTNDTFSSQISNILYEIQLKHRPRKNYYIQTSSVGNPSFTNDNSYSKYTYTTKEQRLLGLFRYWNIINYFYPYKNLLDRNWDDVLKLIIPKIANSTDEKSYHIAILELAVSINDAHAFTFSQVISNEIFGRYYLPVSLKYIDGRTVIEKILPEANGLKIGDIITKINGIDVNEVRKKVSTITIGSNPASTERNINNSILRWVTNSTVELEIENEYGKKIIYIKTVELAVYQKIFSKKEPPFIFRTVNGKKFAIINMGILTTNDIPSMFDQLWNMDAIIFDIRNYPNGTIWYLINYLFPSPILSARFTVPDVTLPGTFFWTSDTIGTGNFSKNYKNRIYILLNEETHSQAEYTVMILEQHPMAIKIGSQTSGADGDVSTFSLPGGILCYYTGISVFYPNYKPTQRIGIVPHIYSYPTIKGVRVGKDEVLDEAFKHYLGTEPIRIIPPAYGLKQNFPNPFNSSTRINYDIPEDAEVTIKVYDIIGREVVILENNFKSAGTYSINFEANKYLLASGIYICRIISQGFNKSIKMTLLK